MKQIAVLLLMVGMSISMAHAQKVVAPTNPNEACEQAWTKYQKADKLWKTGWGLFGAGGGVTVAGVLTMGLSMGAMSPDMPDVPMQSMLGGFLGFSFVVIGGSVLTASIPCICVGHVRRKNALEEYNIHCAQAQEPLTFSVQASQNGVGLAMTF